MCFGNHRTVSRITPRQCVGLWGSSAARNCQYEANSGMLIVTVSYFLGSVSIWYCKSMVSQADMKVAKQESTNWEIIFVFGWSY